MRTIVVVACLCRAARADVPVTLERDHVELLDGRLAIQLAEGSELAGDDAHLDWGDVRLTVSARDLGIARLADMRERIARELRADGAAIVAIEPLAIARPNLGYATRVRAPRTIDGRQLVYSAFTVDRAGQLYELAFFVAGANELEPWASVAARIATTVILHPPRPPVPPQPIRAIGTCTALASLSIDTYPAGTLQIFPASDGTLYSRRTRWSEWLDDSGYHAEAAAGDVHVVCSAATRDALERARRVVSY